MNFCSNCGSPTSQRIPLGDNKNRDVCIKCGAIFYQNPKIIAGCVPTFDDKVLLCKRAIEPRSGFWTLPAGFMENHETCLEAALRESEEEANTHINNPTLYGIFDLPHISQVYIFYQGEVIDGLFSPGIESLEVKLFKENDIPWKNLAFPVIDIMLQYHFKKTKHADICTATINKSWTNNLSTK